MSTSTDCHSELGITEGLIDGLIFICRLLAQRDLAEVGEALLDLWHDDDVAAVFEAAGKVYRGRINEAAKPSRSVSGWEMDEDYANYGKYGTTGIRFKASEQIG